MQVTIEQISPVEKRLAIEVPWPAVAAKLEEAYRELGRGVTLKGFRKGHVPRNILERMFARQVEQEVQRKLVQETFMHVAQEHQIAPVAEPIVDDMALEKGARFRYSARVEVKAEVEPKDYDGIQLERPTPVVTDEEVEKALARKREELTEYKRIEGRDRLEPGDMVLLDVQGEVGKHAIKREGMMVDVIGMPQPTDMIPGLGAALIGAPLEAKEHPLTFTIPDVMPDESVAGIPEQDRKEHDVAGEEARLTITVREAREKLMPALDDDFAKDTGEADTLDELRARIREKLLEAKGKDVDEELRKELVKEVLRKNPFEVPPALVERQTEMLLHRTKLKLAMRGVDVRNLPLDDNRLREQLRAEAREDVRAMFLLDAIATRENVEASEADVEKKLAELAKERGKSVARLKADLQKDGHFESIKHNVREAKTLDLLMSRANITNSQRANSPSEK
ncbi:MAG TPA: trigger factor [Polyangiaceae bacterium]|nr:trigger factor [Polyangiaceae bacterium]